ncbi:MAG TPA: CheR family methyltransferase [Baekduia sp.]|nr:CheR family methyltransferase [Baekduia sp.]
MSIEQSDNGTAKVKSGNIVFRAGRRLRNILRSKLLTAWPLLPFQRAKHRQLLQNADRSDSHTYTSFHRSPAQLAALTGPVIDHVKSSAGATISINVFAGSNGSEAYTIASELLAHRPDIDFSIKASDLQQDMVDMATAAVYTMEEITQGLDVPAEFIDRTFDKLGDSYVVKPSIRSKVTFVQADLLSSALDEQFAPADIVIAQNVLFHMPPEMARRAFANIIRFLKPRAALLLEGTELDMRVELTSDAGLQPLDFKVKEIYAYSRRHISQRWWDYYYGNEPYFPFARQRSRRYGTVFLKG